jgi:metal-responsive CopG/Arc/MetJ family transcriptional regulator
MALKETLLEVTVSLPEELVEYADLRAKELHTSRSEIISSALSAIRASETEKLAAEGYHHYAAEASDFAHASGRAVAESWNEIWQSSTNGKQD